MVVIGLGAAGLGFLGSHLNHRHLVNVGCPTNNPKHHPFHFVTKHLYGWSWHPRRCRAAGRRSPSEHSCVLHQPIARSLCVRRIWRPSWHCPTACARHEDEGRHRHPRRSPLADRSCAATELAPGQRWRPAELSVSERNASFASLGGGRARHSSASVANTQIAETSYQRHLGSPAPRSRERSDRRANLWMCHHVSIADIIQNFREPRERTTELCADLFMRQALRSQTDHMSSLREQHVPPPSPVLGIPDLAEGADQRLARKPEPLRNLIGGITAR